MHCRFTQPLCIVLSVLMFMLMCISLDDSLCTISAHPYANHQGTMDGGRARNSTETVDGSKPRNSIETVDGGRARNSTETVAGPETALRRWMAAGPETARLSMMKSIQGKRRNQNITINKSKVCRRLC